MQYFSIYRYFATCFKVKRALQREFNVECSFESYVMFKRGDVKSAQCYVLRSCSMLHLLTYYFAIKLSQSVDG